MSLPRRFHPGRGTQPDAPAFAGEVSRLRRSRATLLVLLLPSLVGGCGNADADGSGCDRACIVGLTDSYLAALASNDPGAVPLAGNVAFVENLQRLKPGEGLWKTATGGKGGFGIYVPDPRMQQAGWIGLLESGGKPVLLALRLKFDGKQIIEAEHLVAVPAVRDLPNLVQPRRGLLATIPEDRRRSHAELMRIGESYYDALDDNDGSLAPFALDCQRIENGAITAGPGQSQRPGTEPGRVAVAGDCAGQISSQAFVYVDRIDNRRLVAADQVTGLVFGLSQFRQPMDNLPYKVTLADGSTVERNRRNMPYAPFDMAAAHIFKIGADGRIHEIEAVGVSAPYNAPSGWD